MVLRGRCTTRGSHVIKERKDREAERAGDWANVLVQGTNALGESVRKPLYEGNAK